MDPHWTLKPNPTTPTGPATGEMDDFDSTLGVEAFVYQPTPTTRLLIGIPRSGEDEVWPISYIDVEHYDEGNCFELKVDSLPKQGLIATLKHLLKVAETLPETGIPTRI